MQKYVMIFLLLSQSLLALAQETEKITVRSGQDIATVLSSYGLYRLPAFTNGLVTFKDGSTGGGKMNYNVYAGEIQFIDAKGDTLSLANAELVDSVQIDTCLFFYRKGYLQVVAGNGSTKLLMKQHIEFRPVKIGAYGNQSPGSSIENYGKASTSPYVNNTHLTLNEDIVVIRQTSYYLFYKKYREEKANRPGFLAAFPNLQDKIIAFISANKTDFSNGADLRRLMNFCTSN